MTEAPPPSAPEPQTAPAADASHAAHEPHPRLLYALLALLLAAALAFGGWGLWKTFAAEPGTSQSRLREQQAKVDELEQHVATLTRSDQISREANRDLQGTLAERDEEISGLRADVAFYERFVGATGQRRGLSVHELHLLPQAGQAWHFTATLTQNINRGAVSRGRLTLAVEGTRNGALQRLSWADLRQQPDALGTEYSFKYFQEIEGDLVLPSGFKPLRVHTRLAPTGAAPVEQSFTWADAVARPVPGA